MVFMLNWFCFWFWTSLCSLEFKTDIVKGWQSGTRKWGNMERKYKNGMKEWTLASFPFTLWPSVLLDTAGWPCVHAGLLVHACLLPCLWFYPAWCTEPLFFGLHSVCVHYIWVCGSQPEAFGCWVISRANGWTDWPIGLQSGYLWGRWHGSLRIPVEPSAYCCPDTVRMNDHTSVTISLKLPPVPEVSQDSWSFYMMCSIEMWSWYFF